MKLQVNIDVLLRFCPFSQAEPFHWANTHKSNTFTLFDLNDKGLEWNGLWMLMHINDAGLKNIIPVQGKFNSIYFLLMADMTEAKSWRDVCVLLGTKMQEIVVSRGKILELLRPDANTGKVHTLLTVEVFGIVRSLMAFRLTGGTKGMWGKCTWPGIDMLNLFYDPRKKGYELCM